MFAGVFGVGCGGPVLGGYGDWGSRRARMRWRRVKGVLECMGGMRLGLERRFPRLLYDGNGIGRGAIRLCHIVKE